MCVAIYKPKDKRLDPDNLWNCWMDNSDGMGVAIAMGKELLVYKEMKDFPYFRDILERYEEYDMIVHFRIATHGYIDLDNCHPFMISDNVAMIHNGVLSDMDDDEFVRSDTRVFAEDYLKPILADHPEILANKAFLGMITSIAGAWNRIAFLTADGRYAIINEDDGEWIDGCWFSNVHWKWTNWKNTYQYDSKAEKHVLVGSDYVDTDDDDDAIREAYRKGGAAEAMNVAFDAIRDELDEEQNGCVMCGWNIEEGEEFCVIDTDDKNVVERVCADCTLGTQQEMKFEAEMEGDIPDYSG